MSEAPSPAQEAAISVLIVEDEWMVAWDLERSLKEMGYQVLATVDSSHEALRVVSERRPDVALMDIRINGEMDGIATAAALYERFGVPVIYLTAYTDDATLARAADSRPYGYVAKPFTNREVKSAIEVARHKHAADAKVAANARWLSTMFRSIGDGVVACDASRRVRFMNPVAEALTGWSEAEARGRLVEDVVRIRSGAGTQDPGEGPAQGPRLLSRRDGEETEVDDSVAPVEHDGEVLGSVLLLRDVTGQRKVQRRLAVPDRMDSVETMAAGVAHQIYVPLASVIANMGFLSGCLDWVNAALHNGDGREELAAALEEMAKLVDEVRTSAEQIRQVAVELKELGQQHS